MINKFKSRNKIVKKVVGGSSSVQSWYKKLAERYGNKFMGWSASQAGDTYIYGTGTTNIELVSYTRKFFFNDLKQTSLFQ